MWCWHKYPKKWTTINHWESGGIADQQKVCLKCNKAKMRVCI